MKDTNSLKFSFDILSFIALTITFISILFSFNLSIQEIVMSVGIFLIIIATYAYLSLKEIINRHAEEIKKMNEKINIYKDISDLKAKIEILMNYFKMKKRGQAQFTEVLIRIIQIGAIIFAVYIILKALGFSF